MFHILIVDSDNNSRMLMLAILKNSGYKCYIASNSKEALEILKKQHIDLIIVDFIMYEFIDEIHGSYSSLPVLMTTTKQFMEENKKCLLAETDNYTTKPVNGLELLLRVKALLRRKKIKTHHILSIGKVTLNFDTQTVSREDDIQVLPSKEFYLLFKLLSYPGRVFTRIQILKNFWGLDEASSEDTVKEHINRLCDRFIDYPEFEIVKVEGMGYKAIIKE